MSLQVCSCCGWSKATTYQGLRTHQGKTGCTPKGMKIPQCDQFTFNGSQPKMTYMGSPVKPLVDVYTPIKADFPAERVHQSMMGSTLLGIRTQESDGALVKKENTPASPDISTHTNPAATETALMEMMIKSLWGLGQRSLETALNSDNFHPAFGFSTGAQPSLMTESQNLNPQMNPAAAEATSKETNKSLFETPNHKRSYQTAANLDKTHQVFDFTNGTQAFLMPVSQDLGIQMNPAEATVKETNKSFFESPPRSHQSFTSLDKARRALDFSTSAQQIQVIPNLFQHPAVEQNQFLPLDPLVWDLPTTTAQGTAVRPNAEEKEKETEKEKEREAQKLLKARKDRTRADLEQKIQMRKRKVAEVRSSLKACKGSLDAEWLQINSVFIEVMRVVEDTRQKALQPLETRRQDIKKEANDLVQKMQREIDELKKTISDLDKNPDLQVSALTSLDESRDWTDRTVDTSFSFGTLRTTTLAMIEEIHQKLEKLSSVELKRIPAFAVDVKLDPTSAHQCLALSSDGKKVRDGGKNQPAPNDPRRFDLFGSILGLNRLTSGKSYWVVEVRNKTGWDLGVTRGDANRKGKLSLNPDNGYWVVVHYEEEKYAALADPPVCLTLKAKPQKVGVFVDYEEGLVSFYNMTAQTHIYSFTECSFMGEILPYFSPHLKQNEKNVDPLIISAV